MDKYDYVTLKIPRQLRDQVKTLASKKGKSIIDLIKELIRKERNV